MADFFRARRIMAFTSGSVGTGRLFCSHHLWRRSSSDMTSNMRQFEKGSTLQKGSKERSLTGTGHGGRGLRGARGVPGGAG